ncbi:hypothetical protein [Haloferula sp.]|uniref:hypothetical protein n=1 Tax=Haloferula sp. TaxID=2497595 RepID=UPI003C74B33B
MNHSRLIKTTLVAAAAAVFSSCYYDPSYGGYGSSYGVSGVSASFVSTSSDYWFYDPVVRCYYDRRRSCYYDPYLYGYYPRGYTPRPIYNAPHPYGWGGKGYAPIPNGVNGRTLNRNQDRVAQLQARNYAWANQVRVRNDANVERWQRNQATAAANFRGNQNQQRQPSGQATNPFRNPQSQPTRQATNQYRNQQNLADRQAENHYKREAIIADTRARSQASVEAVRARNAELHAQAQQNQAAQRQRAAASQAERQGRQRAAQEAQQQRMQDPRARRNLN